MLRELVSSICLLGLLGSASACSIVAAPDQQNADQQSSNSDESGPAESGPESGSGSESGSEPANDDDAGNPQSPVENAPPENPVDSAESAEENAANPELPEEPPEDAFDSYDGEIAAPQNEQLEYTSTAEDWWADDYCHYFIEDGITYGDLCISQWAPDYYLVHEYDPGQPSNHGTVLMQYYTNVPAGFVMYRDWTDPALAGFPEVMWLYHPADPASANPENFWVVMNDGSSYTLAYIQALVASAAESGGGAGPGQQQSGLPAWDPAFMPINQLALDLISKNIQNTNPGIY